MRTITALLCLAGLLGGCATLPASHPLDSGAVSVTVLDRDAATGKVRLAVENHTREKLAYLWPSVTVSPAPRPGQRDDPYDTAAEGRPEMHDIPLGPGRRQVISFDCRDDGLCALTDVYVGLHVCRQQSSYCDDYEIIWSEQTIASVGERQAR